MTVRKSDNFADIPRIPRAAEKDFRSHYKKNLWPLTYLSRNISNILKRSEEMGQISIAFFDTDGYLLRLYGNSKVLSNLKDRGIEEGTVWTTQTVGSNAVTKGLSQERFCESCGLDHSHPCLLELSLYFAPLRLLHKVTGSSYDNMPMRLGGIAVLFTGCEKNPACQLLAATLAHDIEMTLHFNQTANHLYSRDRSGILIVDTCMNQNQATITYLNDHLFEALKLPREELLFHPLNELLKPEQNRQFYEILNRSRPVSEISMTLTVRERPVLCIVSCDIFNQPGLNARGIIAYISTPRMESRKVSQKVGNTAVLSFSNIIGESPAMQSALRRAALIANTDSNIMILGESGVGKDVFAQAIHNASSRRNKPFIAVNCAALPKDLIASELFGYDTGAFTGAKKSGNMGKFELADGGTIFLDEIGDLPLDLQATLLRVVEQKQFMRLGSNHLIDIDVKIISATNADIPHMIEQRRFRPDLFFRLSTLKLALPPLRARDRDIILLSNHFIHSVARRTGRPDIPVLSPEAEHYLLSLPWAGNVRELQNTMESIVQLYPESVILPEYIAENLNMQIYPVYDFSASYQTPALAVPNTEKMQEKETPGAHRRKTLTESLIREALEKCGNNRSEAAKYLGVARITLYRNMERLGMPEAEKNN